MLDDLYQSLILDHSAQPRNYGPLPDASHQADGYNPLCGDKIHVFVCVRDNALEAVQFVGSGCAISKASASLMTESVRGKTPDEAMAAFDAFRTLVTGQGEARFALDAVTEAKLQALAGVRGFPMRVKCATLAWHTLQAALSRSATPAKTE